jgi:hypothetical protein
MKSKLYKTDHFWEKAWERGISQWEVEKITKQIDKNKLKGKSRIDNSRKRETERIRFKNKRRLFNFDSKRTFVNYNIFC